MAIIALIVPTAFAVTFETVPATRWCPEQHPLEFVQHLSPGWPFKKQEPEPTTLTATHVKAYEDGTHCLVFSDFATYLASPAMPDNYGNIGVMVNVDGYAAYIEHRPTRKLDELRGGKSPDMDVDWYDWLLSPKAAPSSVFAHVSDYLVVSGLRKDSVVTLTLVRMRPDDTMECTTQGSYGTDEILDCTATYHRRTIEVKRVLGDGSTIVNTTR